MRVIDEVVAAKAQAVSDWRDSHIVVLAGLGLASCSMVGLPEDLFEQSCIIHLEKNHLVPSTLCTVWSAFPDAWWVDLSQNSIGEWSKEGFPNALGYLNLVGNHLKACDLVGIQHSNILRLNIGDAMRSDEEFDESMRTISALPFAWTVNDHFVTSADRARALSTLPVEPIAGTPAFHPSWKPTRTSAKEGVILNLMHRLSAATAAADNHKVDVLLEDYIQHALLYNKHLATGSRRQAPLPLPPHMNVLMGMPHRVRLDLSVLLTVSVLFTIPPALLRDGVLLSLKGSMTMAAVEDLLRLPSFARTALVSVLRRISRKEFIDLRAFGAARKKPADLEDWSAPVPLCTYEAAADFHFLRSLKCFLEDPRPVNSLTADPYDPRPQAFSDLEKEILAQLPDCPTLWARADTKSMRTWVAFSARHAVFLLNQSPSCPPLTRPARSVAEEELYFRLLPLLHAAEMTLRDLDIVVSGPAVDGRDIANLARAANLAGPHGRGAKLAGALEVLGPGFLPFSAGLPRASHASLRWKSSDFQLNRAYVKPWLAGVPPTEEEEQAAAAVGRGPSGEETFFVTESNTGAGDEEARPFSRGPVYRLDVRTWEADLLAPEVAQTHCASPPRSPLRARTAEAALEQFPAPFRPHSRSSGDLRMVYPLPAARPPSAGFTGHDAAAARSLVALGHNRDGQDGSAASAASKSVVTISLPSVDHHGCATTDELLLSARASPRALVLDDSMSESQGGMRALLPGELRKSLLADASVVDVVHPPGGGGGSDGAGAVDASRPLSAKAPRPVQGYSADVLWQPNFLLAPQSNVSAYNSAFRSLGVTGEAGELGSYWRGLDRPPVVLLEHTAFGQRIEKALQQPPHTPDQYPLGSSSPAGGSRSQKMAASDALSIDDSIEFSEAKAKASRSSPRIAESPKKLRAPRRTGRSQPAPQPEDLLRSMGTVRNVIALENFNERVRAIRLGAVQRVAPAVLLRQRPAQTPAASPKRPQCSPQPADDQDSVFLTAHPGQDDDECAEGWSSGETAELDSLSVSAATLPAVQRTAPAQSKAILARNSSQYGLIFSAEDWQERGVASASGAVLSAELHPVWPKSTFQVDAAHSRSPPRDACCTSPPPRRPDSARRGMATPLLMDGRGLPGAEDAFVAATPLPAPIPVPTLPPTRSTVAANLDVIRSNPFLKDLLLQRRSRTSPASRRRSADETREVDDDALSTVSGSTLEHGGLIIYEAYQSHVLSGAADFTPSLAAMEHSVTRPRKGAHHLPTSAGDVERRQSSGHVVMSMRTPNSSTVRPRLHRAATHKLSLNRAFRVKLPSLKAQPSEFLLTKSLSSLRQTALEPRCVDKDCI